MALVYRTKMITVRVSPNLKETVKLLAKKEHYDDSEANVIRDAVKALLATMPAKHPAQKFKDNI